MKPATHEPSKVARTPQHEDRERNRNTSLNHEVEEWYVGKRWHINHKQENDHANIGQESTLGQLKRAYRGSPAGVRRLPGIALVEARGRKSTTPVTISSGRVAGSEVPAGEIAALDFSTISSHPPHLSGRLHVVYLPPRQRCCHSASLNEPHL
jgi:hypothetical protein